MRLLRFPVPLLVGMVGLAVFCLGACGTQTDAGVHEVAEDPYLVPAEFPECRWQEGADVDYAEGGGYPTAREALVEYPLAELFYDNFEVIDQTGGTVTWQMSDARGTPAGTVTARKLGSGLWGVETARFCLPSRIVAQANLE